MIRSLARRAHVGLTSTHKAATLTTLGRAYDETEARKWLQFTCTHDACKQTEEGDRIIKKTISTLAYEKGVVLVRCNCDKLHLIADRLVSFGMWTSQKVVALELTIDITPRAGMV
jgi:S-methylmethionine-dependent homocysteine/selenocysteine methylase